MVKQTVLVMAAVATLAACSGTSSGGSDSNATAQIGEQAPSWSDPLVGGGKLSMEQLRGKPVFIDFFATWCPPCNAEAPEVNAAYKEYAPRGLAVIGADVQETPQKATLFVQTHKLSYPAVVDSGTLSDEYRINGMPVGVFIDRTGVVRKIEVGQLSREQLDADIKSIL
jgi:cytochrome c biogenesis protein CcmG, thiol:disulfide interchange protein DsbE